MTRYERRRLKAVLTEDGLGEFQERERNRRRRRDARDYERAAEKAGADARYGVEYESGDEDKWW